MMIMNKTIKSVLQVTGSNIVTIISGIVVGFILPKIITVDGFGYYKTFTLYVTYLGLFSLGIIDGIVLDYGGKNYDELDRPLFRCYFRWYLIIHLFFSSIIFLLSIFINDWNQRFIVISLACNLVAVNCSGYFQNISQITQRFKEYSWRKVLQSICNIIVIAIMYVGYYQTGISNYKFYVASLVIINTSLTVWYIFTYKPIVFGSTVPLFSEAKTIIHFIRIGFPLLFANLSSTLLLTLDRQFVNVLFDNKTYAIYAFAYSMLALVTVATSAISTVIYPTLKRSSLETIERQFPVLVSTISSFVYFLLASYFPLKWFITWYLPNYIDSLVIFRIIFPGLGISSVITVIMHNYYKALGNNLQYFKRCIITIAISFLLNTLSYMIFKSTIAISVASIITMLFWYLYTERYFRVYYSYDGNKNLLYIIVMVLSFYISTYVKQGIVGFLLYILVYSLVTTLFFKKEYPSIKKILIEK